MALDVSLSEHRNAAQAMQSQLNALEEEMHALEGAEAALHQQLTQQKENETFRRALLELQQSATVYEEERQQLLSLQEVFEKIHVRYESVKAAYSQQETLFFSAQAGILASRLTEGHACPVCGAKEHPHPAFLPDNTPTEEQLKTCKQERDELETAFAAAGKAAGEKHSVVEEKEAALVQRAEQTGVAADLLEIATAQKQAEQQARSIEVELKMCQANAERRHVLPAQITAIRGQLAEQQQTLQDITEQRAQCLARQAAALANVQTAAAEIPADMPESADVHNAIREAEQTVNRLTAAFETAQKATQIAQQQVARTTGSLEQVIESLSDREQTHQQQNHTFVILLKQHGFSSEQAVTDALLSAKEMEKRQQRREEFDRRCHEVRTDIARLQQELADENTREALAIPVIQQEVTLLEQQLSDLRVDSTDRQSRLAANQRVLAELQDKLNELEKLGEAYRCVQELSDAANGHMKGKKKLQFELYVQASYFDRILREANKRLSGMTHDRFELVRNDFQETLNDRGLELGVIDHYTGKARHVKTLSGGESFKAALALALGLSDVVQQRSGGVSIDTMFVDEGFGSLDAESLDAAIHTLLSLAGTDRLVGIISHVDELKERIDKKIVVRKSSSGSTVHVEA